MKPGHYLGLFTFAAVVLMACLLASVVVSRETLRATLESIDGQRAEAQATFTDKDEVTVEFPALVRGRRINCVVVANTKRKTHAIFC